MLDIVKILEASGGSFVSKQRNDSDVEQSKEAGTSFEPGGNSRTPSRSKGDTVNLAVEIDPIWRTPELNNKAGLEQLIRPLDSGNLFLPKHLERFEEARDIARSSLVEEVDVASESRITVKDHSLASHDQITNLESAK